MPCYSKGPRGLSVLPRDRRICATTAISPSPPLRQCPSRYAVHARHQLGDKEFRYLRTLIVRAAIHQSFGRELFRLAANNPLPQLSGIEHASVCIRWLAPLHRPVFLVNSRPGLFSATPCKTCNSIAGGGPFSEVTDQFCRVP